MAKRAPRLLFTEDELDTPELQKPIKKAKKAQRKLTKAEAKIPKKKIVQKQRVYDPKENQVVTRLVFEETEKKRPSKLSHAVKTSPVNAVSAVSHRAMAEDSSDSTSAAVTHDVIGSAEGSARTAASVRRTLKDRPYARALKAERAADRANLKALYKEAEIKNTSWGASPLSRFQQKRAIKKAYAEAKAGRAVDNTVKASELAAKAVQKSGEGTSKVMQFVVQHKKGFLILLAIEFHCHRNRTGSDLHHHRRQNRKRRCRSDCRILPDAVWFATTCNADSGRREKRKTQDSGICVRLKL